LFILKSERLKGGFFLLDPSSTTCLKADLLLDVGKPFSTGFRRVPP
jgi:hypothetical protein